MARCRNACILVLGILLPRLQFPNAAQPPPREQHSAPSAPIPPNHDTSGGSNHCPGRTSVHPRTQLARRQPPPTETTATEGAISCALGANHPAHDRNPQGNHHPSATEGAPQCTLGRNQPAGSPHRQRQSPPKAQSHAPSAQIAPPTIPQCSLTAAEGAPQHTLGADYQAQ